LSCIETALAASAWTSPGYLSFAPGMLRWLVFASASATAIASLENDISIGLPVLKKQRPSH